MNRIAIMVSTGYEDIELIAVIDMLQRADIKYDLISSENLSSVKGSCNAIVETIHINNFDFSQYTSIFIPGGPAVENLINNKKVLNIVTKFNLSKKYIYAICAAPSILNKLKILEKVKHTAYPGYEYKPTFINKAVVKDKNIITGSGPGAAMMFALKIIENEKSTIISKNLKNSMKIT